MTTVFGVGYYMLKACFLDHLCIIKYSVVQGYWVTFLAKAQAPSTVTCSAILTVSSPCLDQGPRKRARSHVADRSFTQGGKCAKSVGDSIHNRTVTTTLTSD